MIFRDRDDLLNFVFDWLPSVGVAVVLALGAWGWLALRAFVESCK